MHRAHASMKEIQDKDKSGIVWIKWLMVHNCLTNLLVLKVYIMPFTWVKIRASTTAFLTPLFWHLNRQVLVLFLYHSGNIPNLHLMDSYLDEAGNGASSPTLMTALGGPKAQSAWAKRRTGPCFVVLKPSRVCSQKLDEKWHCAIAPVKNAIMVVKKKNAVRPKKLHSNKTNQTN